MVREIKWCPYTCQMEVREVCGHRAGKITTVYFEEPLDDGMGKIRKRRKKHKNKYARCYQCEYWKTIFNLKIPRYRKIRKIGRISTQKIVKKVRGEVKKIHKNKINAA